jgi:hypothetical protein
MATRKRATQPAASAPVSEAAIAARTGRTWAEWVVTLDGAGARDLSHTAIADLVHGRFGVDDWWAQSVTVGYERLTGKRANLQKADGFAAQITVQQEKLASQDAALKQKRVWAKSLRDLAESAAAD